MVKINYSIEPLKNYIESQLLEINALRSFRKMKVIIVLSILCIIELVAILATFFLKKNYLFEVSVISSTLFYLSTIIDSSYSQEEDEKIIKLREELRNLKKKESNK